jgi:hypothetical protein
MRNLKQHWDVLKQETIRNKTAGLGWGILSVLTGGVGVVAMWIYTSSFLTYVFHETRSARATTALLFISVFLLWLARCWRTYHARIIKDVKDDWINRVDHIRRIGAYEFMGHNLHKKGTDPGFVIDRHFLAELDDWRKGADSATHQISEAHRDAFYKNSVCLQETPDENQFVRWMPERVAVLTRMLKELQSLPSQLRSDSSSERIQQ